MKASEKLGKNTLNDSNCEEHKRLKYLKEAKFLTQRIFRRISENMSYEIFKFLNAQDLLQIRASTLGGFQLVSNITFRAKIKNYFKEKMISSNELIANSTKVNLLLEQTNIYSSQNIIEYLNLIFKYNFRDEGAIIISEVLKINQTLKNLNLCKIY